MTTNKYEKVPREIENEEDLHREQTYDDDSESDYEHDDEEENSDTSTGSWQDFVVWSAWRQHAVAILVALLATVLATAWQHYSTAYHDTPYNNALSTVYGSTFRHEHLAGFKRTANISFCGSLRSKVEQQLEVMDFHVPLESVQAFLLHYVADAMEDDDYSRVLGGYSQILSPKAIKDEEYQCLRQLEVTAGGKDYIKGLTYFYQPPSYSAMYPEVVKNQNSQLGFNENGITGLSSKRQAAPKPAGLSFTGFAAKFINLSPQPILLHWDGKGGHQDSRKLVGEIAPFDSLGTATTPGQSFSVSPVYDSSHALERWVLTADDAVMVYKESKNRSWSIADKQLYHMQLANLEFAKHYLIASHRTWLSHFPRPFPLHPLRHADFVGQQHMLTVGKDKDSTRKVTMEVVSVTPRVFSIDDFLSADECIALMQLALAQGLKGSTLYSGGMAQQQRDVSTRSSTNAWLGRDTSDLTDRIYRRAAQLLDMKENLLQQPPFYFDDADPEAPHHDYVQHSVAESLQVVRYQSSEEYTAHHDFVYPSLRHRYQPTRYATVLFYLNDDFDGGQTNFPRAINPTNHDGITITPKRGKAVLFYNMLPDGNVDDLSQHQALPVTKGEKWLANLWVWEPTIA